MRSAYRCVVLLVVVIVGGELRADEPLCPNIQLGYIGFCNFQETQTTMPSNQGCGGISFRIANFAERMTFTVKAVDFPPKVRFFGLDERATPPATFLLAEAPNAAGSSILTLSTTLPFAVGTYYLEVRPVGTAGAGRFRWSGACSSSTCEQSNGATLPECTPQSDTLTLGVTGCVGLRYNYFAEPGHILGVRAKAHEDTFTPVVKIGATRDQIVATSTAEGNSVQVYARVDTGTRFVFVSGPNYYGTGHPRASVDVEFTCSACTAPAIQFVSADQVVHAGESATLQLVADSKLSTAVTWFRRDGSERVTVGSNPSVVVKPASTARYFAEVTDACGTAVTRDVIVQVAPARARAVKH